MITTANRQYLILRPDDHAVLGESEFGTRGLKAIESIGPFTQIQASGPLVTVHDAVVDAGLGIGHHPHRYNERLFYIEQGQLDHDDSANNIQGHVDAGDVAQFTEGQRGMMHSEWNNGDVATRAYILVYSTDPVPEHAAFAALRDTDAPRYEEGAGVSTKELVGSQSPLRVNGDIRFFAESELMPGAALKLELKAGEGGLISVRAGSVTVDGMEEVLAAGYSLVAPPAETPGLVTLRADEPSRVIRVVHGTGHGFVQGAPRYQARSR